MSSFHAIAPAKINLFLHVVNRRPDGYHELDSLAVFARYGDKISFEEAPKSQADNLFLSGIFSDFLKAEGNASQNSVLKAANLWREESQKRHRNLPFFSFSLEKNLPVAAGIGGGSSDASALLTLLRKSYPIPEISAEDFQELALKLGADGPVTLDPFPKRMQGIGEILTKIPYFPKIGILLVNPRIKVSTPEIFKTLEIKKQTQLDMPPFPSQGWLNEQDLFAFLRKTRNDLEIPAIRLVPEIQTLLSRLGELPGCEIARMSGSGATCFALFKTAEQALKAEKMLHSSPDTPKNWWIWSGETYPHEIS